MYIGTAGKKGNLTALRLRLFNRATAFALALVLLCTGLATIASAATPTVDFQWTKTQSGLQVPDGDAKTLTSLSGVGTYKARVSATLAHANGGPYARGTIKLRIDPKQLQARDGTVTGYVFPNNDVPHIDSVPAGANPDFVYYYDGDVLVIENYAVRSNDANLSVPIEYHVAQYDADGHYKGFHDYVDDTSATYTVELDADGEIATDQITLTLNDKVNADITAFTDSVSKQKTEWVNGFADGWTWNVTRAYTRQANGVPAEFDKLTFTFDDATLASYPGVGFMTMPVDTNLYDVTFEDGDPTNGYKKVTITCKEADGWCETIQGANEPKFQVHIPKSDYIGAVNASASGTVYVKYNVATTAHPIEGPDPDEPISVTKTLTLSWNTPATKDEKDNSYVTYVQQQGSKTTASKSKTNDENGEAQHIWDLTALHEGQNQYQRYTVKSEFDNPRATARLAGAIPTMQITASSSGNLNVGDTVTYTATLTNNKTYDSRQIAFEIPFPADMTVNTTNLQFTVNGAAYTMPNTDYAWDSTNHILTIKKVPVIGPGQTFTATIPATATGPVHTTGFGVLELDQSLIELQNCGTTTSCRMTVRNTGNATTPAGIPFEISFVAPESMIFPDKAFESIKLNGTDITASVNTEFVGGSAVAYNGVAYLPALDQGDEITFTFKGDYYTGTNHNGLQPQGPMMVRGKFGSLLLLPSAAKISPADSQPYATVGFMNKDVKENYQKRPFVFETIDTGLRFLDNYGSRTGTCDNSIGYTDSFYQCHLDSRDAQVKSVTIGKVKPEYVELTTHPDAKITLYGSPNVANSNPTWTKYAELTFKYSDTKPANTPTEGTGKGYYLTNVVHFNYAGEGATKADVQLPDGVLATRLVQENLRKVDWNVNTVLLANGPKVKARLDALFAEYAIPGTNTQLNGGNQQNVYNDMFQFTYDPADAPADGSIPSVDKFWKRQGDSGTIETSKQYDLPPFMRTNGVTQGPVGSSWDIRGNASILLYAEPRREAQVGHNFTSKSFSSTGNVPYNPSGTDFYVIPNELYMTSNLSSDYGNLCTLKDKLDSDEWKRIETVRFYSLQPYGARVRLDTVRIGENLDSTPTSEMKILDVQIEEDWRNSGRQMLIVTVQSALKDINPATCEEGLDIDLGRSAVNNIDQAHIRWDSEYTNIAYWTYGKSLERLDAAEAVVDGLPYDILFTYDSTYPEGIMNNSTGREGKNDPVYWSTAQRNLMKNLTGDNSPQKFLYGSATYSLPQGFTAASDFQKTIAVGDSSSYSQKAWVNPSDEYSYQLSFLNAHRSSRKNIVIYDSLEQSDGSRLPTDQEALGADRRFKGTMTGLSVGGLRGSLGIDPKVYVSTRDNLNLSAGSPDTDLTNTSIWTEVPEAQLDTYPWAQVKAFAVDCSKKSNGTDFELPRDAGLIIEVFMKAPDDATTKTLLSADKPSAAAYNESYAHCVQAASWDNTGAPSSGTAWDPAVVLSSVSNLNLHRAVFTPRATKNLTGHALADDQFSFKITKAGSNDVIATATNKSDGTVTFTPIVATAEDIGSSMTYNVTEVNDGKPGYTYDTAPKTVTVQVVDAGDGQVTVLGDGNWPTFNNKYEARGAISVQGTKEVTGTNPPPLRADQFTFTLYDNNGDEIGMTTNAANGDIVFNNIAVTEANIGTHNFTVKETGDCPFEWVCDTSTKNVSVTVTDNNDGTLTATVSGGTPAFTFTNRYVPAPATGFFSGTLSSYVFLIACALLGGVGAFWLRRKRRALLD